MLAAAEDGYYSFSASGNFETQLFFVSWQGEKKRLEKYQPLPEAENPDGWLKFSSVNGVLGACVTEDGNLATLEYIRCSGEWDTTGLTEEQVKSLATPYRNEEYLRLLDGKTGEELKCAKLEQDGSLVLEEGSLIAADGKRYMLCQNEMGNGIAIINENGKVESIALYGGYCSQILRLADGSLAAVAQNTAGNRVLSILREDDTFLDIYVVPTDAVQVAAGAEGKDFFYTTAEACYRFQSETNTTEKLFSWTIAGINLSHVILGPEMGRENALHVIVSSADSSAAASSAQPFSIFTFSSKNKGVETEAEAETEADTEANPAPQVLILLTLSPDDILRDSVTAFNRSSLDCKIEILDLSALFAESLAQNESLEEGLIRYLQTREEGKTPDLLDLSGFSLSRLASQGLLEDLYPYLDTDADLNRADYFENMLALLESEGKLCSTGAAFRIHTVLGPSSIVSDTAGWSYEEYQAALASMQPDCDAFGAYTTAEDIFSACLSVELSGLSSGLSAESSGEEESDVLETLLRFAASFPAKDPTAGRVRNDETDTADLRIYQGKQLLLSDTIYNFASFLRSGYMFPGKVTCIGYPCQSGTGNAAEITTMSDGKNFAIFSGSEQKEEAWRWIRSFFTEEYAETVSEFPMRKDVFDARLSEAKTAQYRTDGNGKTLFDTKTGDPIEKERETMYLSNWVAVPIYSMMDEQEQKLRNLVESTTKLYTPTNDQIAELCLEAEPYFESAASLEETTEKMKAIIGEG